MAKQAANKNGKNAKHKKESFLTLQPLSSGISITEEGADVKGCIFVGNKDNLKIKQCLTILHHDGRLGKSKKNVI